MADDQQDACCIIGLCCGGDDGKKQTDALAQWLKHYVGGLDHGVRQHLATVLLAGWDFAPKGSLVELKRTLGAMARAYPYK
jgi:hypothetical protein